MRFPTHIREIHRNLAEFPRMGGKFGRQVNNFLDTHFNQIELQTLSLVTYHMIKYGHEIIFHMRKRMVS